MYFADELIKDNLLTRNEILEFIQSNFLCNVNNIRKIDVYSYPKRGIEDELMQKGFTKIPHYKKLQYYNKQDNILAIINNSGEVKNYQYKLQIDMLNIILHKKIESDYHIADSSKSYWNKWSEQVIEKHNLNSIDKILIGSTFNIAYMHNEANITEFLRDVNISNDVAAKCHERLEFNKTEELDYQLEEFDEQRVKNYIYFDYLYTVQDIRFNAFLKDKTWFNKHNDTLYFIYRNQRGKNILVLDWNSADVIHNITYYFSRKYSIKEFYYYGKCGSMSKLHNVGDLVAPTCSYYNGETIELTNTLSRIYKEVKTVSVDSPLEETHQFIKEKTEIGIDTVEMELHALSRVSSGNLNAMYYISDVLGSNHNLSKKQDLVGLRLQIAKDMYNYINN